MARAFEPIIFRGVIYGAGQVRALLTVGHVLFFGGANHNAMVLRSGVGEEFYTTNRNFIYVGDFYDRKRGRLCKERFHQNPKIANEHAEACESEKLRELAASNVALVAREHRKLVFPERLPTGVAKKRHTTPPTCNPEHRVKPNRSGRQPSCAR